MEQINKIRKELDILENNLKKQKHEYLIDKYFDNKPFTLEMFMNRVSDFETYNIRGDFDGRFGNFCVYAKLDKDTNVCIEFDTYIEDEDYWDYEKEEPKQEPKEMWNPIHYFEKKINSLKKNLTEHINYEIRDNEIYFYLGNLKFN